jgi:ABC-2 type transport system ATP-binding protein
VEALKGLDLEVRRGEVFGLLGPNGSGKTTTMKLLLGLIFPTSGSAEVLGRAPGNVRANQHIGFLPEESYLYRFLNADETLDFYGRLFRLGRAERKRRIDELIRMVGLQEARRRAVKGYSKGMSRRIGLAQALINDPDLLLLDEPTSGLDPIGTREIKDLILNLKARGKTVLLCSHLLADVEDVCDRIAILKSGELKVVGVVSDLLTVKDITQVRLRHVTPDALEHLKTVLAREKAELVEVSHPRSTLEELFLRIVGAAPVDSPRD